MVDPVILSFRDPQALNPYNAISIEGLDTDLIIPKYYGMGNDSKLYNLIRKKRIVTLIAGLNPDFEDLETYSGLRDDLYRLISASRSGKVQLRFKNGDVVVAAINGFVTKFETDHFNRDQEVKLTIECRDPMLKSLTQVPVVYEVPDAGTLIITDDKSTAPHGFEFIAKITALTTFLTISNDEGLIFTVRPKDYFFTNDLLYFSSDFNKKYLYLIRGGVKTHLADVIDLHPVWPLIFPGTNEFQVSGASIVWQSISHYETYWGV